MAFVGIDSLVQPSGEFGLLEFGLENLPEASRESCPWRV